MIRPARLLERSRLLLLVWLLLSLGFLATTVGSYLTSKRLIVDAIVASELPLTSSNIYSEIQKDLVRPILVSSTMASDTFLRDWVIGCWQAPILAGKAGGRPRRASLGGRQSGQGVE